MTTDYTQYRRPHYSRGDTVRIVGCGDLDGREAEVVHEQALQTVTTQVVTYFYTLCLPNGAYLKLAEENLAPVVEREVEKE